jgi:hypothetical protein
MRPSILSLPTRVSVMILSATVAVAALVASASASPAVQGTSSAGAQAVAGKASTGKVKFGGTVYEQQGESFAEAYDRVSRAYGGSLDAVRMFYPGLPKSWRSIRSKVGSTPLVVSFKADTAGVLSGRYDRRLTQWFEHAPTGHRTFWTYWHEPENDSVDTAKYRQAWKHINALAAAADNPELRSTLILMCWTLSPGSGRDWKDYYAGGRTVDVLGFDCYNTGRRSGVYRDPGSILAPVRKAAASVDKPWGVAEFGSTVVDADGGQQGRATWLRGMADYIRGHGGKFATYFDSFVGFDYRLHDDVSRNAWKDVVQHY